MVHVGENVHFTWLCISLHVECTYFDATCEDYVLDTVSMAANGNN